MERIEVTQEEVDKIARLYLHDNLSHRNMAKVMERSTAWCTRVLKENGIYIDNPSGYAANTNELAAEIARLKKKKWNNGEYKSSNHKPFFEPGLFYKAICKATNREFHDFENTSGSLSEQVFHLHPELRGQSKYKRSKAGKNGEPWYAPYFDFERMEHHERPTIACLDCGWTTTDVNNGGGFMTAHVQKEHGSVVEYTTRNPAHKHLFPTAMMREEYAARHVDSSKDEFTVCKICGERLTSITNTHLQSKHGITHEEYKKRFGYEDIVSDVMSDKLSTITTTYNMGRNTYGENKMEKKFKLAIASIDGMKNQKPIDKFMYDWCLEEEKVLIELDGEYWHGHQSKNGYHYGQLSNFVKDVKKNKCAVDNGYTLYRILEGAITNLLPETFPSKEELLTFLERHHAPIENHPLLHLKEYDVIHNQEYCKRNYDEMMSNGAAVDTLLEFWTTFYPPEKYINECIDLTKRNQTTTWLKGIFAHAYYNSKKGTGRGLHELFNDRSLLREVVKYRLGLNKKRELFDVSIMQLYRGIAVRTVYNVGVFPIEQARGVYQNGVKYDDVVYDPYAGWGSRMLACAERGAHYIGNDINVHLKDGYERIIKEKELKNCLVTFGDSKTYQESLKGKVDFIFTSPPFYYDELYSYSEAPKGLDQQTWFQSELLPVLVNCHAYLKAEGKVVLDMNEKYVVELSHCLLSAGFTIVSTEYYGVKKSHYMRSSGQSKRQALITCEKSKKTNTENQ